MVEVNHAKPNPSISGPQLRAAQRLLDVAWWLGDGWTKTSEKTSRQANDVNWKVGQVAVTGRPFDDFFYQR